MSITTMSPSLQPRSRAILVLAPVSSIKIKRSGSRSSWLSNHSCRRAWMSGRECPGVPVLACPCQAANEALKRITLRARWGTQPGRFQRAFGPPLLVPLDRRGWRDGKPCRRSTCRHSLVNRRHNPTTKRDSTGPCHICLLNKTQTLNHVFKPKGIFFLRFYLR